MAKMTSFISHILAQPKSRLCRWPWPHPSPRAQTIRRMTPILRPHQARRGQQVLTDLLRTPRPHPPILSTGPITSLFIINCTTVWKNDSACSILLAIWNCSLQFYGGLNNADSPPVRVSALICWNTYLLLQIAWDALGAKKGCSEWNDSLIFLAELGAAHCYPQPGSKSNQSWLKDNPSDNVALTVSL